VPGKKVKAIDIYNKYWSTYPALYFEYDTSVMGEVEETAKIKFLDGANQVYWGREIAPGEKITDEFLSTGPNGAWKLPTKASTASHTYEFTNRWTRTEDSKTYTTDEIKTLTVVEGATYTFAPIFDENWKMYEIYFYDADEKLMDGYPIEVQYGLPIPEPELIPYKDDSKLPLEKRYGFKGYTLKNSTAIIDLTSVKTAQNYHLYSYFEEESVYDSVTNLAYFEIGPGYDYEDTDNPGYNTLGANSCTLRVKTGVKLSGKVTLPSYYEGKPITYIYNGGFTSQDEITQTFCNRVMENLN
jgi:hypothetical protein